MGYQESGIPGEDARGAGCARGVWSAYEYNARSCDYNHVGYNEPDTVLIAQLMGSRRAKTGRRQFRHAFGNVRDSESPNGGRRRWPADWCGRRRCAPAICAIPNGPQSTFAAESFIDELAAAAKTDPLEFRMKMLTAGTADDSGFRRARSIAVLKAAAEAYGWDPRPSPATAPPRETF